MRKAITPPPEERYPPADLAEEALHAWIKSQGINVSRDRAVTNSDGVVVARTFACDRKGNPQNTRRLQERDCTRTTRGSKRIGCPMGIKLRAVDISEPNSFWEVSYTRDGSGTHNHEPSFDVRVHAAHSQRAANSDIISTPVTTASLVDAQSAAGIAVSNIHASMLLANPNAMLASKDISNAKSASRRQLLSTQTRLEALFKLLEEYEFWYKYEVDPQTSRLKNLLWTHQATTEYQRHYPDVLVLDCTNKTNKFNLPQHNIVSVTGMNTVLPVAQCWLPGEAAPDFEWALATLRHSLSAFNVTASAMPART